MNPINWLFLFIMFLMIFYLFNMTTDYCTLPISAKSKSMKMFYSKSYDWMW